MITLREAQSQDLPLMMAWRSNPLVYQGFYQQTEPLIWEEHFKWFQSRNRDWRTLIAEYDGRPIGVVTIGQLDNWTPEIGYYVGEVSLWGKGFGEAIVKKGLDWLRENTKWDNCHTTVLDSNERSIKLLKRLGFKKVCKAREGESRYEVKLWN